MPKKTEILVLGGDMRQKALSEILSKTGKNPSYINCKIEHEVLKEAVEKADVIILPLPASTDGINIFSSNSDFNLNFSQLLSLLNEKTILFAGSLENDFMNELDERKIKYYDYYLSESFVLFNAFLTAQGAMRLLMENTNEYLVGKKALVTGFGRVGKAVADTLKRNGLSVYVAARNNIQLKNAKCLGYKTIELNYVENYINLFDFIFGTIPSRVISSFAVESMQDTATYFEIASYPYGCDKNDFEKYNKKIVLANGLPGKYLPFSAAKGIIEACQEISDTNIFS